jgi:hypothetical protein
VIGRHRIVSLAIVSALCAALVGVVGAQPASAAIAFSVTPDDGLVNGQSVTAHGEGFPANATVFLQVCLVGDPTCGAGQNVFSDPSGSFSAPYTVARVIGRHRDCLQWSCEVRASINGVTQAAWPIAFAQIQPDAQVRRRSDGVIFFDNKYDNEPPLGNCCEQQKNHAITPGGKWSYAVVVQNDGDDDDDFTVTGDAGPINFFTIRYFVGYYDVTALVTGSGFTFHGVAPGASRTMGVQFRATASAPAGDFTSTRVLFSSVTEPVATDGVDLKVTVPL